MNMKEQSINTLRGKLQLVWQCGKCETEHISPTDTDSLVEAEIEGNPYYQQECSCSAILWRKPIKVFCPICKLVNVVNGESL